MPTPSIQVDFVDVSLLDLVYWAADYYDVSFMLGDSELLRTPTVTVVTHGSIPIDEGWDLFVSAMHESGYAVVAWGAYARVVPLAEAVSLPLEVRIGPPR